jgi:hypothetical protein
LLLYSHEGLGDTTTNICHYGDHSQHWYRYGILSLLWPWKIQKSVSATLGPNQSSSFIISRLTGHLWHDHDELSLEKTETEVRTLYVNHPNRYIKLGGRGPLAVLFDLLFGPTQFSKMGLKVSSFNICFWYLIRTLF